MVIFCLLLDFYKKNIPSPLEDRFMSEICEYNHQQIEQKWQEKWTEEKAFYFENKKDSTGKKYTFAMCYYPSGRLHMGHLRTYTINDIVNRGNRLKGFNALNVISADAFGLPAENAAIQNKTHPKEWTYQNINSMNQELKSLGFSFDWSKFFRSCDEEYYKYQQEFFIKFYEKGIAYQGKSLINWDPVDKTVLSNEQVIDGKGWRSGALVEKREMTQWFFKISDYSEELLEDLKELDWPDKIKKMQENWIGKSEGCEIDFQLDCDFILPNDKKEFGYNNYNKIRIYTTRPETIFGTSAILLSPNHSLVKLLTEVNKEQEIINFIKECNTGSVSEVDIAKREKIGLRIKFQHENKIHELSAIHPFTKEKLPVYIANYVLDYGTGAVMSVPGHDIRDRDFTEKYNLQNKIVIDENDILINSDFLNGLSSKEAKEKIIEKIEEKSFGKKKINYKLRDWCISRQRYWGCPIPMIHCKNCGIVAEKIENLPIRLPNNVIFDGEGNPLAKCEEFIKCKCSKCGQEAKRETDTMDTYVESAWYFLKQISNLKDKSFNLQDILDVMPTDLYLGGPEHATTHMLYARFFMKALRDCGYFGDAKNIDSNWQNSYKNKNCFEPFKKFITTGMVCHDAYRDKYNNYYYPEEVDLKNKKAFKKNTNEELEIIPGIKMSKSKKNTVQPCNVISKYGADSARFFVASDNPIDNDFDWKSGGIENIAKYLKKIFIFLIENKNNFYSVCERNNLSMSSQNLYQFDDKKILKLFYQYLISFERYEFNVCIAKFREIMNQVMTNCSNGFFASIFFIRDLLVAISPIIPHFSEEVIEHLQVARPGFYSFPVAKEEWNISDNIIFPIQVNGKIKLKLEVKNDITQQELLDIVNKRLDISIENIKDIIYVKNKILNIIVH